MTQPDRFDLEEWPVAEPPDGFADGVMDAVDRLEKSRRRRRIVASSLGGFVLAAAAAVAVFSRPAVPVHAPAASGEITADDRREIEIAPGVLAVVERAAHLVWSAAGVVQDRGDVFYRLAPGARLDVTTPAGAIASQGACSRVMIVPSAAGAPTVLVAVAQGEVELRGKADRVVLAAGRYARFDADRIRTDLDDTDGAMAYQLASDRARSYVDSRIVRDTPIAVSSATSPRPPPRVPSAPPPSSASAAPSASAPPIKRPVRVPRCECQQGDSLCACFD
jgi:hypothetical protein